MKKFLDCIISNIIRIFRRSFNARGNLLMSFSQSRSLLKFEIEMLRGSSSSKLRHFQLASWIFLSQNRNLPVSRLTVNADPLNN